jgi:hypothetical protein
MVERYMCAKDWYADIIYRDQTESPNSEFRFLSIPMDPMAVVLILCLAT